MTRRIERVNGQIQREIGELLLTGVKDPRLSRLVSVVGVETSVDLHYAKVLYSVMGTEKEKADVAKALESAAPFIRKELMPRLKLRHTPELRFVLDETMERADKVLRIMDKLEAEKHSE